MNGSLKQWSIVTLQGEVMRKTLLAALLVLSLFVCNSCESDWGTATLGAAGGAVATGGGYEYVIDRETKRVEEDYKEGRIDQREYEIRKDQIQRLSILK
jgi:hypothetical protein